MAHCKQSAKRARQNDELRVKNRAMKSTMRTAMKRVEDAVKAQDRAVATVSYTLATQKIDKCAKRRVIHPNAAARQKSRLARLLAGLK